MKIFSYFYKSHYSNLTIRLKFHPSTQADSKIQQIKALKQEPPKSKSSQRIKKFNKIPKSNEFNTHPSHETNHKTLQNENLKKNQHFKTNIIRKLWRSPVRALHFRSLPSTRHASYEDVERTKRTVEIVMVIVVSSVGKWKNSRFLF